MTRYDLNDGDIKIMREHGLAIKLSAKQARGVIDQYDVDDELMAALDEAQGAVRSGSAGRAYVVLVIDV